MRLLKRGSKRTELGVKEKGKGKVKRVQTWDGNGMGVPGEDSFNFEVRC